jgi:endonuclease/exonuclease/phosphatase (EEP) superfamily protein YafD
MCAATTEAENVLTEQPVEVGETSRAQRVGRLLIDGIVGLIAVSALVHPAARMFARWNWRIDALTHFYILATGVTLVACLALLIRRRPRLAVLYVVLLVFQVGLGFRFSYANPVVAAEGAPRLKLFTANAFMGRIDYDTLAEIVRKEKPDILCLVEVRQNLVTKLEATGLHQDYPYRYVHPVGAQGQLIWFREKPILVEEPKIFSPKGNPAYQAIIKLGSQHVRIWLVHPPNPIGQGRDRANGDIKALGEAIGKAGGSQIVVGDLNRTEGSPFFDDFMRDTGLRDSRLGFGRQTSWPSASPYRIAIDHGFVSSDLAVVDRRLAPSIGSDHLPVILEVARAASSADDVAAANSSTNREAHHSSRAEGPERSSENLARSTARK